MALEGVEFAYPSRDANVLCGLTLRCQAGEMLALCGPSGAGLCVCTTELLTLTTQVKSCVCIYCIQKTNQTRLL